MHNICNLRASDVQTARNCCLKLQSLETCMHVRPCTKTRSQLYGAIGSPRYFLGALASTNESICRCGLLRCSECQPMMSQAHGDVQVHQSTVCHHHFSTTPRLDIYILCAHTNTICRQNSPRYSKHPPGTSGERLIVRVCWPTVHHHHFSNTAARCLHISSWHIITLMNQSAGVAQPNVLNANR